MVSLVFAQLESDHMAFVSQQLPKSLCTMFFVWLDAGSVFDEKGAYQPSNDIDESTLTHKVDARHR
jgi:hypothetical protein